MGLKDFFSNKIQVEDLQPGDHIYTWRVMRAYAHHGIYVGNGQVIHFVAGSHEAAEGALDKLMAEIKQNAFMVLIRSNSSRPSKCEKCSIHVNSGRCVAKNCVECFLQGDHLYRCKYEASPIVQQLRRSGTCTTEKASEVEKILHRAEYLLSHDIGFGKYHLLKRNCEDFALYCRLGVVGVGQGVSGQVAKLKKTMPRVREIEVEDLVAELQAETHQETTQPSASTQE